MYLNLEDKKLTINEVLGQLQLYEQNEELKEKMERELNIFIV